MRGSIVVLAAALLLAACQHGTSGPIAAQDIRAACGQIRTWPPEFQKQIAAELGKLPPTHPIWQLARDAVAARDAIRICRGEGVPAPVIEAIVAEIRKKERRIHAR